MTSRPMVSRMDGTIAPMTDAEFAEWIEAPASVAPLVPREITNFQARALLMQMPGSAAGRTLFQDVDDTLAQLGGVSWQAWEYTTILPRRSELIATMAAQFNLTEAQIDGMFIAAAQISV